MDIRSRQRQGQGTESDPCLVGTWENPHAKKLRIVHISDTHMKHSDYLLDIPHGDVLVHSGDFANHHETRKLKDREAFERVSDTITDFFSRVPHPHKIFVAGNHESAFNPYRIFGTGTIQSRLHGVTYLQDSGTVISGVSFYGTPWSSSRHMGFSSRELPKHWSKIPTSTDVLITHMPPLNVLDLAYSKSKVKATEALTSEQRDAIPDRCSVCGEAWHWDKQHWGCKDLRQTVFKDIRPKLHLFGHVHNQNGLELHDGIVFSNASMDLCHRANVIDYYYTQDGEEEEEDEEEEG